VRAQGEFCNPVAKVLEDVVEIDRREQLVLELAEYRGDLVRCEPVLGQFALEAPSAPGPPEVGPR